jgi:hypothetical protein
MTVEEFEGIKEKIETIKSKRAKAEGALETIKATMKNDFGCASVKEAETKIEELDAEIEVEKERLDGLMTELESLTDWEKL